MRDTRAPISLRAVTVAAALASALLLSACGDELDEERSLLERVQVQQGGPDPFLVIERAPLQIPANLGELPVPQPGVASRVDPQPDALVAAALGGTPRTSAGVAGPGERQLLASLGAVNVPSDIRAQIEAEHAAVLAEQETGLLTRALSGVFNPYRDQQLDPIAEVVRLRRVYPGATTPNAPLARPQ